MHEFGESNNCEAGKWNLIRVVSSFVDDLMCCGMSINIETKNW